MTITQTGRRLALVGLLALIGALLPLTGASAIDGDEALELSGDSNTAVSIANSEVVYTPLGEAGPDNPPTEALIGTAEVFADNLASGALQGAALENGRPLLLNSSSDDVDADVLAELDRLLGGTGTVHILGGVAAQGEGVETALTDAGYTVNRFEGATRTETAIAIAGAAGAETALLVRSGATGDDATQAFADSLGAGALAATNGYSVLFTQTEVLTGSTAEFLASEDAPSNVIIVGGTAAISEDTEAEVAEILGEENVSRVAGPTRFDTAVALNGLRDGELGSYAIAVDGQADDSWADGFTMANLSGLNNAPVVLTNQGMVPEATETYLESIDTREARAHFTNTFIVCGASSAGAACAALAELFGLTVVPWPPVAPPVEDNTGVIIATGMDTYTYQPEDGSDEVDVDYADDDQNVFSVDGAAATYDAFVANISVGDTITVTVDDAGTPDDDSDDITTHALVNVDAAETGTIGDVNTNAGTFWIIEPVSGAQISAMAIDIASTCDLYSVDGGIVIAAQFMAALNEGDVFSTTEDVAGNVTCDIANNTVAGTATVVDTVTADTHTFMIGNLGDEFENPNDDYFATSMAKFDAGDLLITVDGEAITDYADFGDVLSTGDEVSYARTNDQESVTLVNAAPSTISGQLVDGGTSTAFDIATNPGDESVTPAGDPDTLYIVNGLVALAADFDAAASAGDQVSYTPADAAAGTAETVTLTDQDLSGAIDDGTVGTAPDLVGNTYDVLSSAGDVVLITQGYSEAGDDRFFVNGEEVLFGDFEDDPDSEDDLQGIIDGDVTGTISVEAGLAGNVHSLTTTAV